MWRERGGLPQDSQPRGEERAGRSCLLGAVGKWGAGRSGAHLCAFALEQGAASAWRPPVGASRALRRHQALTGWPSQLETLSLVAGRLAEVERQAAAGDRAGARAGLALLYGDAGDCVKVRWVGAGGEAGGGWGWAGARAGLALLYGNAGDCVQVRLARGGGGEALHF